MADMRDRMMTFFGRHIDAFICLMLLGLTLMVYGQVAGHAFINYDDPDYITENVHVRIGLTLDSIQWAITATHASNWHPLTWLSHMLDVDLFGMNAGGHHMVNLLLHGAGTLLLFIVFRKTTGDRWQSAFIAALFALHPLHVESVAWTAERKDVLSTFFCFAALWRYTLYVAAPVFKNYWPVLLYFTLGLLSKTMVVTLPIVLLLMDYWPLRRSRGNKDKALPCLTGPCVSPSFLIVEKIPFFMLSAASGVVTFLTQQSGQSVMRLDVLPIGTRLTHSLIAYTGYIRKMLYPSDLGVFYPHPGMSAWWEISGAGLFIGAVSLAALRLRRNHPYFLVGWIWYLVTLVPVIGIVQVGLQGMADRYTYVPLIGLFIIIAWGVPELAARWYPKGFKPALPAVIFLVGLTFISWMQVKLWANNFLLYEHTLRVTVDNYKVHNNLGVALADRNRTAAAITHYAKALQIKPNYEHALLNLANVLTEQGRTGEAVMLFRRVLQINPDSVKAHGNLAVVLDNQGRTEEAMNHFNSALRIKPNYDMAHYNLSNALTSQGRTAEAMAHLQEAVRSNPFFAQAHNNLGIAMAEQDRVVEAIGHYYSALHAKPDFEEAHNNLGIALFRLGKTNEAVGHFKAALRINPGFIEARNNLEEIRMFQK